MFAVLWSRWCISHPAYRRVAVGGVRVEPLCRPRPSLPAVREQADEAGGEEEPGREFGNGMARFGDPLHTPYKCVAALWLRTRTDAEDCPFV